VVRGGGGRGRGRRRFLCTYSTTVQYSTVQYSTETFRKFFPTISLTLSRSHALSSGLTSKNASKKNSPQADSTETFWKFFPTISLTLSRTLQRIDF